jgi:hypothetical protein
MVAAAYLIDPGGRLSIAATISDHSVITCTACDHRVITRHHVFVDVANLRVDRRSTLSIED